jgi:hypothetical protein
MSVVRSALSEMSAYSAISQYNLYRFWKTLEAKYGHNAMDHSDIIDKISQIFSNKMQASEKFQTFLVRFNSETNVISPQVNFRLGIIHISPTGPAKALCLPVASIYPAVEHCRNNRTTYEATNKFLIDADQSITSQQVSEIQEVQKFISSSTTNAKRVRSIGDKEISTSKSKFKDFKNREIEQPIFYTANQREKKKETVACDCGRSYIKWDEFIANNTRRSKTPTISLETAVEGEWESQATYSNALPNHGKYLYTNIILYIISYLHQHYRYLSVSRGVLGYYGVRTYL